MGGPGLQQGAIHRTMLIAEQRLDLRRAHQLLQKAAHDLVIEEPLAVLGKGGGVPNLIVGDQTDKPAVQQVVLELLEQKPLGADPVERLKERGLQELLRRNWGPSAAKARERRNEPIKGLIRQFPDPPQRMTGRDSLLDQHVVEQGAAALTVT